MCSDQGPCPSRYLHFMCGLGTMSNWCPASGYYLIGSIGFLSIMSCHVKHIIIYWSYKTCDACSCQMHIISYSYTYSCSCSCSCQIMYISCKNLAQILSFHIMSYLIISYLVMSCACPCTHVHLGIATFGHRSLWERSPKAYVTIPHRFLWRHMPLYHVNLVPRRSHFHPPEPVGPLETYT